MNNDSFSTALATLVFVALIDPTRPIRAIKVLRLVFKARTCFDMGLREAKQAVDAMRDGRGELVLRQRCGESDAEFRVHAMLMETVFTTHRDSAPVHRVQL